MIFQVIKPESCVPCGKRIKFGKISLKCRDCRVVTHPECRERCPLPCIPNMAGTPVKIGEVECLVLLIVGKILGLNLTGIQVYSVCMSERARLCMYRCI